MTKKTDLNGGISSAWKKYKTTGNVQLRNQLAIAYFSIVKKEALKIKNRLPPWSSSDIDDLISSGSLGLLSAIEAFDLSRGVKFETYCVPRVRGAMIDDLRAMDWVPRLLRSRSSSYQRLVESTNGNNNQGGKEPTVQEVAVFLGVSIEEAEKIQSEKEVFFTKTWHLQRAPTRDDPGEFRGPYYDTIEDRKFLNPEEEVSKGDGFEELLYCLSDLERVIITLYFRDGYHMWKIGQILQLSESRVSQIRSRALEKIRDFLEFSKDYTAKEAWRDTDRNS